MTDRSDLTDPIAVTQRELLTVLEAVLTCSAELEQLEATEDWFSSDSLSLLQTAHEILTGYLGIQELDYEYDEDSEQETIGLCFDE